MTRIAPQLSALAVPIDSVQPHPQNARQGDVGAISASLQRFSQQKPIVVQASTRRIVAGNHLWRAAAALGWTAIAANVVDLDDATALAFLIADNRTQELGSTDQDALAAILTELAQTDNLAGVGYDGDDVDALLADIRTASPFLDAFLAAPSEQPATGEPHEEETAAGYFQLTFSLTLPQRDLVRRALNEAKARWGTSTSLDALVALCDDFLARQVAP